MSKYVFLQINPLRLGNAQHFGHFSRLTQFIIFKKYEKHTNPVVMTDTLIRNKYMTYEFDLHESKEEGRAEGKTEGKLEMVDAMFAKTKLTDEEIAAISGIPQDEIAKRRAQR